VVYDKTNSGLPYNYISCITIDKDNKKWIGTFGGGLSMFDDNLWTVFNTENSNIVSNEIFDIKIDSIGNKWIASTMGLIKFDGINFIQYSTSNNVMINEYIYDIGFDISNQIWIGKALGLVKINDKIKNYYFTSNSSLPNNEITCIEIDKFGDKWVGSWGGLAYYSEKVFCELKESNYCINNQDIVTFATKQTFNPNNTFTAQLSDSTGMFYDDAIPIILGSLKAREGGTINITIPDSIPPGEHYRIRVSASSPFARGVDNGYDIKILPSPKPVIINYSDSIIPGSTMEYFSEYGTEYKWVITGGTFLSDSTKQNVTVKWNTSGKASISLSLTNANGCTGTVTKEVDIISIKPKITGKQSACEQTTETYFTKKVSMADIFWEVENGNIINGQANSDTVVIEWLVAGQGKIKLTQSINNFSDERVLDINILPKPARPTIEQAGGKLISSSSNGNQWFHNDTLIQGATQQILIPLYMDGYYQVQVTSANSCVSEFSEKYDYNTNPRATFRIGDGQIFTAKPGEEITVPIYFIGVDDISGLAIESIQARFRYNATILISTDGNSGVIKEGTRYVDLTVPYLKKDLLKSLNMIAVLGNNIETEFILDSIRIKGDAVRILEKEYTAKFNLEGVCIEGGRPRLIDASGQIGLHLLRPNPTEDKLTIEYEIIESGMTEIYLVNSFGVRVKDILMSEGTVGSFVIEADLRDLGSGMYFIVLETPTVRKMEKVEIIR
jgi:hypothetical protein